jgi:Domain of unknown function (DUF4160)
LTLAGGRWHRRPRAGDIQVLGIVIGMFFNERGVPHCHVYEEYEVTIEIETATVHGEFPHKALRLALEWMHLHKQELLEDWQLARQGRPLKRIAPLESP